MALLELEVDASQLQRIYEATLENDKKLAALSSSAASVRKTVVDGIVASNRPVWESTVEAMANHAADFSDEQLIAFVYGIRQGMTGKFGERMNEVIAARVKEIEDTQPEQSEVSDAERNALIEEARKLRAFYANLKGLLGLQNVDVSSVPEPSSLRGVSGGRSRRPKLKVNYTHTVDGRPRKNASDNLSSIANSVWPGKDFLGDRTAALWEYLQKPGPDPEGNSQIGFDKTDLPEEFSVYLPNGKLLFMAAVDSQEPVVAEDSEDDEDNDDDE